MVWLAHVRLGGVGTPVMLYNDIMSTGESQFPPILMCDSVGIPNNEKREETGSPQLTLCHCIT